MPTARPISPTASYDHLHTLAHHLESQLPLRTYCTMTLPYRDCGSVSPLRLQHAYNVFSDHLQRRLRPSVGVIRGTELDPQAHYHMALVSPLPIDTRDVEDSWHVAAGDVRSELVRAETFIPGRGGLPYLMKMDDVFYSENIRLYRRDLDPSSMDSRQRRDYSRIWAPTNRVPGEIW